ncbi:ChrR family anti-sigma-E factor [Pseudorhodoferax sp. Leaf267]|uniref:ChrR family anti-sigma-E factor n=1 Tax=Pseudorhodoferax sp. Leaf267 TaxID=1736316 RepID=UPI0006FC23F5|nr:ChrR family anti-sigma-E factor [Pseudorhodoferax sp. Leaf267]KQP18353.1 transcriptional regulator [Pseudorhodoferax sp. Leaf267]
MSIQHHPGDDLLLAQAAGQLPMGPSLVLASHVENCARCQAQLRLLEFAGGALLEALPEAGLRNDALARTLQCIDASQSVPITPVQGPPPLPAGTSWPRALTGCAIARWRWVAPGIHYSRVQVAQDPDANLFLLRIAAGKYLPQHTHSEREFTQVLHGSFHDGRAQFSAGDFDATDGRVHHQPVVQAGGECICLASVEGRVLFDGFFARQLGALMGM